jgi:hypothetical protein
MGAIPHLLLRSHAPHRSRSRSRFRRPEAHHKGVLTIVFAATRWRGIGTGSRALSRPQHASLSAVSRDERVAPAHGRV